MGVPVKTIDEVTSYIATFAFPLPCAGPDPLDLSDILYLPTGTV